MFAALPGLTELAKTAAAKRAHAADSMHSTSALYLGFNFGSSVIIIFVNKSLFSGGLRFECTFALNRG